MKEHSRFAFQGLLGSILVLMIFSPLTRGVIGTFLIEILFTFILLFSIYLIRKDRRILWVGAVLVIPSIVLFWVSFLINSNLLHLVANGLTLTFVGIVIIILTHRVFFSDQVEAYLIHGALSIYLLIGFFWALLYTSIELVAPGSHIGFEQFIGRGAIKDLKGNFDLLIYHSFVTLTTLGYGDITPINPLVRTLSVIEAIMGQFYIATLVAGLIGRILRKDATR